MGLGKDCGDRILGFGLAPLLILIFLLVLLLSELYNSKKKGE